MSVVPLVVMSVGAVGIGRGAWQMWEGEGSASWPKVRGIVQGSRVEAHGGGRGPKWYAAVVDYGYQVGDHWYRSDRWSFGRDNQFGSYDDAERSATRYREADPIDVYHHPSVVSRSVLVPGRGNDGLATAGMSAAIFLLALYFYLNT
jgi:hypothetical protein